MSDEHFQVERDERIATVKINRPEKRNAFKQVMWDQLADIMKELTADPSVFVIVLRGAGDRVFSAGADIAEFDQGEPDEAEIRARGQAVDECLSAIQECPKAVIAMVHGYAMGGGCSLALACDLRLAGESAQFGIPAAKLGIVYTVQSTASLTAIAGPANAARVLFTGAAFDAKTSYDMGIATAVYPDDRLAEETYRLARQIAQNAPFSIAGAKKIIQAYLADPSFKQAPEVHELQVQSFLTADHREGARAFMEKRRPVFRGT